MVNVPFFAWYWRLVALVLCLGCSGVDSTTRVVGNVVRDAAPEAADAAACGACVALHCSDEAAACRGTPARCAPGLPARVGLVQCAAALCRCVP